MLRLIFGVLVGTVLVVQAACKPLPSSDRVLFDFESDGELDMIHWKCGTFFALSSEHAFHGARCLKIELYPSAYPGLSPLMDVSDWGGYTAFAMDMFNPASEPVVLTLRVDDKEKANYEDRYNGRVVVGPGRTSFVLPFDSLVTSGSHRPLDLRKIQRWLLFSTSPDTRQVFYLDHVRLVAGASKEGR